MDLASYVTRFDQSMFFKSAKHDYARLKIVYFYETRVVLTRKLPRL